MQDSLFKAVECFVNVTQMIDARKMPMAMAYFFSRLLLIVIMSMRLCVNDWMHFMKKAIHWKVPAVWISMMVR